MAILSPALLREALWTAVAKLPLFLSRRFHYVITFVLLR
jgi:hypothetical protein